MANVKISQLPIDTSLSDDAYLLGIDSGATVRIPASVFQQNLNDEYLPYERVYWDNPSTTMLSSVTEVVPHNSSEKTVVQIYGYSSALLLCQVSNTSDSTCRVRATNLYTGEMLDSGRIDPTTVTLSDFLSGEDTSPLAERVTSLEATVADLPTNIATEKYVDDEISAALGTILATLNRI